MYSLVGVNMDADNYGGFLYNHEDSTIMLHPWEAVTSFARDMQLVCLPYYFENAINSVTSDFNGAPMFKDGVCLNKSLTLLGCVGEKILFADSAFNIFRKTRDKALEWLNKYRCWNKDVLNFEDANWGLYYRDDDRFIELREKSNKNVVSASRRYITLTKQGFDATKEDITKDADFRFFLYKNGYKTLLTEELQGVPFVVTCETKQRFTDEGAEYNVCEPKAYIGKYEVGKVLKEYSVRKMTLGASLYGIPTLGVGAFVDSYIREVHTNATHISGRVFENCKDLKFAHLEEGVLDVGGKLFNGCEKLEFIHLPKSMFPVDNKTRSGILGAITEGLVTWQTGSERTPITIEIPKRDSKTKTKFLSDFNGLDETIRNGFVLVEY